MEIQQLSGVMQFANPRFLHRWVAAFRQRVSATKAEPDFALLEDDALYQENTSLSEDIEVLRFLEAEIYALSDQFKTELGQSGAPTS